MSLISSKRLKPGLISVNFRWDCRVQSKILKSFKIKGAVVRYVLQGKVSISRQHVATLHFQLRRRPPETDGAKHEDSHSMQFSSAERPLASWLLINGNYQQIIYLVESDDEIWTSKPNVFLNLAQDDDALDFSVLIDFGCDFSSFDTMIFAKGVGIPVHSASLCKSSAVFFAMFQHKMSEAMTKRVTIDDLNSNTMKILLFYLYREDVVPPIEEMDIEFVIDLYSAADKYDVLGLKRKCCIHFSQNLASDNVLSVLKFAEFYSLRQLRVAAIRYIVEHSFLVFQLPEWKEFTQEQPNLFTEICQRIAFRMGTSDSGFT